MSHEQLYMDKCYNPGKAFAQRMYGGASSGHYEEGVDARSGLPTGNFHWVPGNPGPSDDPAGDALAAAVAAQFSGLEALFWERQRKYGPGNISEFGDYGILVRLHDKLARLKRHYAEGVGNMPDESVRDTWADISVYAMIALLWLDGRWPGQGAKP